MADKSEWIKWLPGLVTRTGIRVDPNQEMVGLGAADLAAGFFQGFPISSSSSRTPVAEAAGAKTQVTGVVGAVAVALLLLVAPNLLEHLPAAALAAVVIASAVGLIEAADLVRIFRIQRWEFWLDRALQADGIELGFAELKDPVKDKLKRFGLFGQIGDAFFFPTIGAAAASYLDSHAVDWVDWEDRSTTKSRSLS